jgi:hypothetical protein
MSSLSRIVVVLVGQFQYRLVHNAAQPDDCPADKLAGPFTVGDEPGLADARQVACGCQVDIDICIGMCLQYRCGSDSVTLPSTICLMLSASVRPMQLV